MAKETFCVCICTQAEQGGLSFSKVKEFSNNKKGFNSLIKCVQKSGEQQEASIYLMEATGIYYEALAYHLHKLKLPVGVLLPNKVKHFGKSLNVKSKTDAIDARVIAQLGAERTIPLWNPPSETYKHLRDLTRLYTALKTQRTSFKNQRSSAKSGHQPHPHILQTLKGIIAKLDREIEKTQRAIQAFIRTNAEMQRKVNQLLTIKGVGNITIAIILAETQGFAHIRNRKQLASYAGYDIVQRQSGTSVKGKTRISKKGNSKIRAALHFPALVASRHNEELAKVYHRINQNKPTKMIGATALQRKILLLMYTLWKNNEVYLSPAQRNLFDNTRTGDSVTPETMLLLHQTKTPYQKADRLKGLPAQDELQLTKSN